MSRLAIVSTEDCKSKSCGLECIKYCPVNLTGLKCIELDEKKIARINENLCRGSGLCVKKCPFNAIEIINLPKELDGEVTHRYGKNSFKLHRLPLPRKGQVLGLVGQNGTGKSTSVKVLSGEIKPNLGELDDVPEWDEIIKYYRGSSLQNYFKSIKENGIVVATKPQAVDLIPKVAKGVVSDLINSVDERGVAEDLKVEFSLEKVWDREISVLSGGELQRVAIAATLAKDADAYFIDEPTSYLDISERMNIAKRIRDLAVDKFVIVVEHDLAILDYLSDLVQLYYGTSSAYGVVTQPMSVRDGINNFLEGYVPSENMRFRSEPLKFNRSELTDYVVDRRFPLITYGEMGKEYDTFSMKVRPGQLYPGDIVGIIGPNGIGKSTFVKLVAGVIEPSIIKEEIELKRKRIVEEEDEENDNIFAEEGEKLELVLSYKPQYLDTENESTVQEVLQNVNYKVVSSSFYKTELIGPLGLEKLMSHRISTLSGGELQRVGIATCLAKEADLYLIDEPSAFISAEDRLMVAKTIRRMIMHRRAAAFVIEHDLMLQSYISDRIIHFTGDPGVSGEASEPLSVKDGMNSFLKIQGVTFRRDQLSGRPRVNKLDSKLDKEQKSSGDYYLG